MQVGSRRAGAHLIPGSGALAVAGALAGAAAAGAGFYRHDTLTLIARFPPGGVGTCLRVPACGRFIPGAGTMPGAGG